ncbi:MAG: SH3 domain-containing protein [Leptospirales bacterium]|nr:SH3 domain-containing protein [Leptospirales bacterium]
MAGRLVMTMNMLRIYLLLSAALLATTASSAETLKYSTASALFVRAEPNLQARTINPLPPGTPLNVEKTTHLGNYQGQTSPWYRIPSINGYVFGAFLSDTKPKPMPTVKFTSSNQPLPCGGGDGYILVESILQITGNRVLFQQHQFSLGGSEESTETGTLSISSSGLVLELQGGKRNISGNPLFSEPNANRSVALPSRKIALTWNHATQGFLSPHHSEFLQNPAFIIRQDLCQFVRRSSLSKDRDGKECVVWGDQIVQEGFYCNRISPLHK